MPSGNTALELYCTFFFFLLLINARDGGASAMTDRGKKTDVNGLRRAANKPTTVLLLLLPKLPFFHSFPPTLSSSFSFIAPNFQARRQASEKTPPKFLSNGRKEQQQISAASVLFAFRGDAWGRHRFLLPLKDFFPLSLSAIFKCVLSRLFCSAFSGGGGMT